MQWPYNDIVPDDAYPHDTLYKDVIEQIARDIKSGDTHAIEVLLDSVSFTDLKAFLPESR